MGWLGRKHDFERAVKHELPVLYRVARRMGCRADEAEDVVQTTLVKAYQAWDRFDGRHLRSWLIRILRNERLMNLRHEHHELSLDDDAAIEVSDTPFWNELSWKMQADQIMEELENLPEIYRLTLHLCDVEQMTYEQAAVSMDVPVGTVRSRLFRARAILRSRLAPVMGQLEGAWS